MEQPGTEFATIEEKRNIMAKITKKQFISIITDFLKEHPEKEVYVPSLQNRLRNGRWGFHAYALCWSSGEVMCRPWAGANIYWSARLERLNKNELRDIVGRCFMRTNPARDLHKE